MSHRREQLAATLRRTIGQILEQGLNDPRVKGLISVTEVKIVPDGNVAIVLVSVLPAEEGELTVHGLRHAARHIAGQVEKRVRIRHMPRLDFRLDTTLKTQARVLKAIKDAVEESGLIDDTTQEIDDTTKNQPKGNHSS